MRRKALLIFGTNLYREVRVIREGEEASVNELREWTKSIPKDAQSA
ncbi:MAG: hypothetical protein FWG29_11005 [Treponema sp.]|nr:hypothetical protein [Treponema sp.]